MNLYGLLLMLYFDLSYIVGGIYAIPKLKISLLTYYKNESIKEAWRLSNYIPFVNNVYKMDME